MLKALNIERPVLVGHSLAFYDPAHPPMEIEMNDIKRRIDEIEAGGVDEQKKLLELEAAIAKFETVLHQSNAAVANMPPLPPRSPIGAAVTFGMQKYTAIPVPVLAIYACPHNWDRFPANEPTRKAALVADDTARCNVWADAFSRGVPTAHVVRPIADHYVYLSNEAQVVREMNDFLAKLP